MLVRVLLFGPEADAAGAREVRVEVPSGATCADLRSRMETDIPALGPSLGSGRFAVNSEFAPDSAPVREDDEIALIGLVSGG